MKTYKRVALTLAVLLHASLLLHLVPVGKQRPPKQQVVTAKLTKPTEILDKSDVQKGEGIRCPETYDGIGVLLAYDGRVLRVARGWPADAAGIVAGDVIESPWNLYPVGGFMEFDLTRGATTTRYRLRTARVCYKPEL